MNICYKNNSLDMKHLRQIDYECLKGERVWWPNLRGEKFEGVIKEWNGHIASVITDEGEEKDIEC